jgi:uncharacterized 2Fe-2S/4Fe-4S cluster protein (DUF4445 family)
MKHFSLTFRPDGKQISIHAGATLLEAAGQAGIILNTVCGGKGTCKKCQVTLDPDGRQVLACQHHINSDLTVTIPPASRFFEHKILTEGVSPKTKTQPAVSLAGKPDIYKKYLKFAPSGNIFGVAIDIGTTTVVAELVDMADGKHLATQAALNPQTKYGDDVISRIAYAQSDEKLAELHKVIIDCINQLISQLCKQTSTNPMHIYEMCVVGNTTMNHIFLKYPIKQLGQTPFKPFSVDAHEVPAAQLGLKINSAGNIHTVENIAGFVGSDTTAVALAVDIGSAKEVTLAVDIGTNGEIVLGTKKKLYAASCAAGPAFEGARISCGSRAMEGAIQAVVVNEDDIDLDVIGGGLPRSICGSGLIDAAALLLDLGILDRSGRLLEPIQVGEKLSKAISSRMIKRNKELAFCLSRAANVNEREVFLTQQDIRQVQLAKAAIRAGIKLLQKKIGIEENGVHSTPYVTDIKQVLLAGAFGNYIRRESALRIGLLPNVPLESIHFVGNAAASGAEMMLLSSALRAEAKRLARKIKYVEIANEPDFQDVFADCMSF